MKRGKLTAVLEVRMAGSVVFLVVAVTMGAMHIWDIRGFSSRSRKRLESGGLLGDLYRRLPRWTFRAFGYWCVLVGCGQLVFFYAITHH